MKRLFDLSLVLAAAVVLVLAVPVLLVAVAVQLTFPGTSPVLDKPRGAAPASNVDGK